MRGYYQIGARESRAASSMERSAFRGWNLSGKRWLIPVRICLALGLLLCIYLAGRRGIGDWYSRQGSPASIQTAIKWDRDNPEYYDALGTLTHFYAVTGNLSESVQFYESATRLSPYDAHFWSDLGAAYDWAGRTDDALNAFQRALRLFPNSPRSTGDSPISTFGLTEFQRGCAPFRLFSQETARRIGTCSCLPPARRVTIARFWRCFLSRLLYSLTISTSKRKRAT